MKRPAGRLAAAAAILAALTGAVRGEGAAVVDEARKGVVTIRAAVPGAGRRVVEPFMLEDSAQGAVMGSGVVFSPDGLILTANHILRDDSDLSAVLWDLSEYRAEIVARDANLDVALLRVQSGDLVPIPWRPAAPRVGEPCFALGTMAVFAADPVPSVSAGIVSAVHRTLEGEAGEQAAPFLLDLIETDARVAPGQSGGALVDAQGLLLGMCVAVYSPEPAQGIRAFALPADEWLKRGIDRLLQTGHIPFGTFGARVMPLTFERARRYNLQPMHGVVVGEVTPGGAFETAGIAAGDVVTRINGEAVRLVSRFRQMEMRLEPDSTAKVAVVRPGTAGVEDREVTVGGEPAASDARPRDFAWRQMRVRDIDAEARRRWGISAVRGVVVVEVPSGSRSYQAGVRIGDVIVEVNDHAVRDLEAFINAAHTIPRASMARVRTTEGIGHIRGENGGQ